jgi:hypothetical protein
MACANDAEIGKLHERMQTKGFPSTDPLMQKVFSAKEATRILRLQLHDIERRQKPKPPAEVPAWIKTRNAQLPPAVEEGTRTTDDGRI